MAGRGSRAGGVMRQGEAVRWEQQLRGRGSSVIGSSVIGAVVVG